MPTHKASQPHLRAVVHIGPIKTGSTAFSAQMVASQDRGDLGSHLVYALPRAVRRNDKDVIVTPEQIRYLLPKLEWSRQSAELTERSKSNMTSNVYRDRVRDYLDSLVADLRTLGAPQVTVFFVEETLSRLSHPEQLTAELLERFDQVDYFFVARAQQFIVPSAISQRVKMRSYPKIWDARVDSYLANENLANQFDYSQIMQRWTPTSTRARLFCVPFLETDRGTQNLFHRILDTVGVTAELGEPVRRKVNVTPSRFEISALSMYKRLTYPWSRDGLPVGSRKRKLYESAARLFTKVAGIIKSPRWEISASDRAQIIEHYVAGNERFATMLGANSQSTEWRQWFADAEKIN